MLDHALYTFKDKAWEIPEAELEFSQAEIGKGKYGVSIFWSKFLLYIAWLHPLTPYWKMAGWKEENNTFKLVVITEIFRVHPDTQAKYAQLYGHC